MSEYPTLIRCSHPSDCVSWTSNDNIELFHKVYIKLVDYCFIVSPNL